ncbi:MAG: response regulator [Verrucomicrobiales bacterium]|nr:response regulator [Verrucomicrobiales bacterium]
MAGIDLDSGALQELLRVAFPLHVVIGNDDRLRAVGPLLTKLYPSIQTRSALSESFLLTNTTKAALTFQALAQLRSITLEIRHSIPVLRLSGPLITLPDPTAIAFLGTPEIPTTVVLSDLARHHHQRQTQPASAAPTPPPTGRRRPRVLVVDDHPVNRLLATELLRLRHYEAIPIDGGKAAIQAIQDSAVDFVLMDIQMPEVSGIDATRAIRELEKTRGGHVPIVAVTAHAFSEDRERCLHAGMDAYLSKPLRVDQLIATLESLGQNAAPIHAGRTVESSPEHPEANAATQLPHPSPLPASPGVVASESAPHVRLIQGDPALVATVAEVFLQQTPQILAAIDGAIRRRHASDLAFHAHRLKGSLSYLEVPNLEAAARGLERQGKADRWDQVPVWWEELKSGLDQLNRELTELLHSAVDAETSARSLA